MVDRSRRADRARPSGHIRIAAAMIPPRRGAGTHWPRGSRSCLTGSFRRPTGTDYPRQVDKPSRHSCGPTLSSPGPTWPGGARLPGIASAVDNARPVGHARFRLELREPRHSDVPHSSCPARPVDEEGSIKTAQRIASLDQVKGGAILVARAAHLEIRIVATLAMFGKYVARCSSRVAAGRSAGSRPMGAIERPTLRSSRPTADHCTFDGPSFTLRDPVSSGWTDDYGGGESSADCRDCVLAVSRRHSVPAARRPPILHAAGHMTDGPREVHVDARANGLALSRSL
jgi:hypothetical protein